MNILGFFTGRPGWQEVLFILVVVLLIFGPKQLPNIARYLGRMVSELKKGKDEFLDELKNSDEENHDNKNNKKDDENDE
jgi:sec-independent protein translocase protein TatA